MLAASGVKRRSAASRFGVHRVHHVHGVHLTVRRAQRANRRVTWPAPKHQLPGLHGRSPRERQACDVPHDTSSSRTPRTAHRFACGANPFSNRLRIGDSAERQVRIGVVGGDHPQRADADKPLPEGDRELRVLDAVELDLLEVPREDPAADPDPLAREFVSAPPRARATSTRRSRAAPAAAGRRASRSRRWRSRSRGRRCRQWRLRRTTRS